MRRCRGRTGLAQGDCREGICWILVAARPPMGQRQQPEHPRARKQSEQQQWRRDAFRANPNACGNHACPAKQLTTATPANPPPALAAITLGIWRSLQWPISWASTASIEFPTLYPGVPQSVAPCCGTFCSSGATRAPVAVARAGPLRLTPRHPQRSQSGACRALREPVHWNDVLPALAVTRKGRADVSSATLQRRPVPSRNGPPP